MTLNLKMYEQAFLGAKMMFESKEITKEEYLNILKGFDIEKIVATDSDEFNRKQELNKMVNLAINSISALV